MDKKIKDMPKNMSEIQSVGKSREDKLDLYKDFWTQHRITLLSLQMQYIYNKKPEPTDIVQPQETTIKKNPKKKIDLQYQTGFLFAHKENSGKDIKVFDIVKGYKYLNQLFNTSPDQKISADDIELRQFMKIMLQLKHECILEQFLLIYDWMLKEIISLKYSMIEKQEDRISWVANTHKVIINNIQKFALKTPYFNEYLKTDRKQTERFLQATLYCFVAEKYNFHINQYYSQAFSVVMPEKRKRIKPNIMSVEEKQS